MINKYLLSTKNIFYLYILSFFYPRPIYYFPISPIVYVRLDDIIWAILVLTWFLKYGISVNKIIKIPLAKSILFFLFLCLISTLRILSLGGGAKPLLHSLLYIFRLFEYASIYFITSFLTIRQKEREKYLNLFILASTGIALVSILQYIGLLPELEPVQHNLKTRGILSTFTSGPLLSSTLLIGIILLLRKITINRILFLPVIIASIVIQVIALLFTLTRSVYIGTIVGIIVYILVIGKLRYKFLLALILAFIGWYLYKIIEILFPNPEVLIEKMSWESRKYGWNAFKEIISDDLSILLLGVGFFNWRYILAEQTLIYGGHNNYLSVLGELGIIGLILYLRIWIGFLYLSLKVGDSYGKTYFSILIGLLISCIMQETLYPVYVMEGFLGIVMLLSALIFKSNKMLIRNGKT